MTPEQLLEQAQEAQAAFWDAMQELEAEFGECDGLDGMELIHFDVDSLRDWIAENNS